MFQNFRCSPIGLDCEPQTRREWRRSARCGVVPVPYQTHTEPPDGNERSTAKSHDASLGLRSNRLSAPIKRREQVSGSRWSLRFCFVLFCFGLLSTRWASQDGAAELCAVQYMLYCTVRAHTVHTYVLLFDETGRSDEDISHKLSILAPRRESVTDPITSEPAALEVEDRRGEDRWYLWCTRVHTTSMYRPYSTYVSLVGTVKI